MNIVEIASKIGKSTDEVLELFDLIGINAVNEYVDLDNSQIKQLVAYLEKSNEKRNEKRSSLSLEDYIIKKYKIFIDTGSLLYDESEKFLDELKPLLKKHGSQLIVTTSSIEELNSYLKNYENEEIKNKSRKILSILKSMHNDNLIDLRGEKSDSNLDNIFMFVFTKFRTKYNLLLITQDNKLAEDIMKIGDSKSVKSPFKIAAKRINKYGQLADNNVRKPNRNRVINKFKLATELTSISNEELNITNIPNAGDYVLSSTGRIKLTNIIGSGGEGSVFETDGEYVAKVYKKERITKRQYEKIKLMVSKKINKEGICWPEDIIYNEDKEFIGYIMKRAQGKDIRRTLFGKPLIQRNFPDWKRRDLVEVCKNILDKIIYLHDRNVILGDINGLNILVTETREVYFVDTDSYQVEGFPCPVGTATFTAPEIQGSDGYATFLRTFGNEHFAIAVLMFMILVPGKHPYAQQGGDTQTDNIKKMDFSYRLDENYNYKAPEGSWRYIWSHLSYKMKVAFYNTFMKDGEFSVENTRLSAREWRGRMRKYLEILDDGTLAKNDIMSEDIFPTRSKKSSKVTYIQCKLCGEDSDEEKCKKGICSKCLKDGKEEYKCISCDNMILYTNEMIHIKNRKDMYCSACKKKIYEERVCIDCGSEFKISFGEYGDKKSEGHELPKRCRACRKKIRKNKESNTVEDKLRDLFNI